MEGIELGMPQNHGQEAHRVAPQTYGSPFFDGPAADVERPPSAKYLDADGPQPSDPESNGRVHARKRSRLGRCLSQVAFTSRMTLRFFGVGLMVVFLLIAILRWPAPIVEVHSKRDSVMCMLFVVGLLCVAMEDAVGINKSAIMLLLAATMWTLLAVGFHPNKSETGARTLHHELNRGLRDVGSVILFLLPAMGVVETVDHFEGFALVTKIIRRGMNGQKFRLMPIICVLTFFLSSVIDNLTSTIVALKILRHVVADDDEYRCMCGGLVVIASNAGGAFSPIGDVTTTMLWIQGKITPASTVVWLILPSFVAGTLPLAGAYYQLRRAEAPPRPAAKTAKSPKHKSYEHEPLKFGAPDEAVGEEITTEKILVLAVGLGSILMVPVLKMMCGVPPYLGMLLALGVMWLFTDALGDKSEAARAAGHGAAEAEHPAEHQGIIAALHKIDLTGLFFFTGVLLAVGALDSAGILHRYGESLVHVVGDNPVPLCTLLGISSAFVDNVPLVEGAIDMFRETEADAPLWQLVALAAGTGGSILSVGSIAGVTFMSMEGVSFLWYCKRISCLAFTGFIAGIATYQLERTVFA